jgi:hypothetical protein
MEQGTSIEDSPNLPKSKSLTVMSPTTEGITEYVQKENVPQTRTEQSLRDSPITVNGTDSPKEPLTPQKVNGEIVPQATSTPASNGILCTEQLSKS